MDVSLFADRVDPLLAISRDVKALANIKATDDRQTILHSVYFGIKHGGSKL